MNSIAQNHIKIRKVNNNFISEKIKTSKFNNDLKTARMQAKNGHTIPADDKFYDEKIQAIKKKYMNNK